ncbi:RNA polymerase sigma factor [Empedobacter tilapiae]|uniref:RNA polymerase sigma factor n=1 Tax=Empedobacter tilapiae TaxID=2491114 RepID=UPI0014577710|nr:RNA polymerase sigma factor [Empedobacter tilapiae]
MKIENTPYNDKELLDLCEAGQELGYSKLYQKYSKQVYNTVLRLVSEESEAEDLTQDIFISFFGDIQKMKSVDYLGAWFKRVAINKSISHLRKRKVYFTDIENTQLIDESEEELVEMEHLEGRIAEVQSAIEALSVESRTIVNLFLFENIPQEEIGKMLGMTSATVRSKYHRAKNKIAQTLQQTIYYE